MALGGLDAGSTFGGMWSSREMALSAAFEPTVIIVFAALATHPKLEAAGDANFRLVE